ncbi:MAG: PQQ-binding-like beta-propeller repeat protein [Anaerolineae bacterium]|nr:PQQ-binding-like beta-propeller repeat protein [Anaerolineae bacterium]
MRHESWPGLIAVGEALYAANLEHIEALNADTGKVYWSFPDTDQRNSTPFYSTPVLAPDFGENGLLLVAGFKDQTVYGLALGSSVAERPDELWRFAGAGGQYVGTGTVAGDLFIIGNGDGKVYALRLQDGSLAWDFATQDRVWATPVVVEDTVYVASLDHHLYALDVESGAERWRFEASGAISATPVLARGDLWVGDFTSTLYQIDLETQDAVWTFEANDWLWASPLLDGDTLYFADVGGDVYALDVVARTMVWDSPVSLDDILHSQPALNEDGSLLYVAGYEKGTVHAIDVASGTERQSWGTNIEDPGRLPGDLVTDGKRLYTMPILVQERVQAFDLTTGELLWSAPQVEE